MDRQTIENWLKIKKALELAGKKDRLNLLQPNWKTCTKNGTETVAPTALDGFHVNYVGDLPDGWEAFEVTPDNTYRVFA